MSSLSYRPEVDGLRAIAVLAVMVFHLDPELLPGGYLGVDIFFVISGYLITSILVQDITSDKFSYLNFYNRRIKRIYPVFIFTIAMVSVIASALFLYEETEQLRKTIELSFVFLSNFYFAHGQSYFDLSANENPVLHIWSLAVEEQFYLIFPLLLVWGYKRYKSLFFKKLILWLFLCFMLMSFIPKSGYDLVRLHNTYYISFIRFPELLVGSYLALLEKKANRHAKIMLNLGFVGLLLTLFFYHKGMPFLPGLYLLLPCILTAIVIYFSSLPSFVNAFLSSKPLVFIGKLSYSLYLFHWVFISFSFYITGEKSLSLFAILNIVILSFLFSFLSYRFLEQPIRKSKLTFKKSLFYLYLIPSLIVFGYNFSVKHYLKEKEQAQKASNVINVSYKNLDIPSKIITIGDSHAGHLSEFLNYVGSKEGWRSDILGLGDCMLFVDTNYQIEQKKPCQENWQKIQNYPVVFISAFYALKRGDSPIPRFAPENFVLPDFDARFKRMVEFLAKDKKSVCFCR